MPHVDGYATWLSSDFVVSKREAVGDEFAGNDVTYVEQTEQHATAHAVAQA